MRLKIRSENPLKEVVSQVVFHFKGGFPLFAETTRSELASTRHLAEQFPVIAS